MNNLINQNVMGWKRQLQTCLEPNFVQGTIIKTCQAPLRGIWLKKYGETFSRFYTSKLQQITKKICRRQFQVWRSSRLRFLWMETRPQALMGLQLFFILNLACYPFKCSPCNPIIFQFRQGTWRGECNNYYSCP